MGSTILPISPMVSCCSPFADAPLVLPPHSPQAHHGHCVVSHSPHGDRVLRVTETPVSCRPRAPHAPHHYTLECDRFPMHPIAYLRINKTRVKSFGHFTANLHVTKNMSLQLMRVESNVVKGQTVRADKLRCLHFGVRQLVDSAQTYARHHLRQEQIHSPTSRCPVCTFTLALTLTRQRRQEFSRAIQSAIRRCSTACLGTSHTAAARREPTASSPAA